MTLRLPRFQENIPLVDEKGLPTLTFHIWWDQFATNLEDAINTLSDQVAAIAAAQAAAAAAQATADVVTTNQKITSSWIIPASALSATDAGTSASITVLDHTRYYGDTTQLAITGATLTGLAYDTTYGVYYDDPTFSDTTPSFQTTTTLSHALNNYVEGRHFLGSITTPVSGGTGTSGGAAPPGTGGDSIDKYDLR